MGDRQHRETVYHTSEIEHRYGEKVRVLANPFLLTHLATLCARDTRQPQVDELIRLLYRDLVQTVVNCEFPRRTARVETRMISQHPRGFYQGQVIDSSTRVITVAVARAGILPSAVCFEVLNQILDPRRVRQDHLFMNRVTDDRGQVTGISLAGSKIGGDAEGAIVLIPDPMGATGSSVSRALEIYENEVPGKTARYISLNLIVTPEYIRRVHDHYPEVSIYAIRLDRGLSDPQVLDTIPGTRWDEERGLDDHQYIVPGGGGLGEVLNNAEV